MSDNPFYAAAQEALHHECTDEADFLVQEAIRTDSPEVVWRPENLNILRLLDAAAYQLCRAQLAAHFKRRIKFSELDRLVRRTVRPAASSNVPTVEMKDRQFHEIAADALVNLRASNRNLFVRAGEIVEVISDESGVARIRPISLDILYSHIDSTSQFCHATRGISSPPRGVASHILSQGPEYWGFPSLDSIVQIPVLRSDGTILETPGYDASSSLYYAPHPRLQAMPAVPNPPYYEDVQEAISVIDDVIGDFPFVDDASRDNMLGLLLTPIARPLYSGCTPMAIIDAPTQGTGKSLLVEVFSLIATGTLAAMTPYPPDDTELIKSIGSFLREGSPIIIFDNITHILRSSVLAMAITSERFKGRLLQQSVTIDVPQRAVWVGTGNNVRTGEEMRRRCYQIRIDAQSGTPYLNREYRHADLKKHVLDNRHRIIWALITLAAGWVKAGRPLRTGVQFLGGFSDWHKTIDGILAVAGRKSFLGNLTNFQEDADDETAEWASLLERLYAHFQDRQWTVKECVVAINSLNLKDELPFALQAAEKKGSLASACGYAFRARMKKRFGNKELYLERSKGRNNNNTHGWQVIKGSDRIST